MARRSRTFAWITASLALLAVLLGTLWYALAPPLAPVPARESFRLEGVTLVEPGAGRRSARTLSIREGRIDAVEGSGAKASGPFTGAYVVPGLVDLHVHYPPSIARGNQELWSLLFLAHGVTAVRETGSIDGSSLAHRNALRAGRVAGPRLFTCGAMLDGEGPSFPTNRVVRDAEEARRAVADLAARGVDCIKVYNMLGREAFETIRDEAARRGLPLVGHQPHAVPFEEARDIDLQHFTGAVRVDVARVAREDFRYEDWAGMDDARMDHVVAVARARGIAFTPTLVNGRMRPRNLDPRGPEQDQGDTGLRHLPAFWWTVWRTVWGPAYGPGEKGLHDHFRERQRAISHEVWRRGVPLHAGTDTLMPFVAPGSSLWGELEEWVAAGIPLESAWEAATRAAGRVLGVPGLGTLDPGAPADLLVFREDPTRDLAARDTLLAVVAGGRLYRREALDDALARADAHFRGRLYGTVMSGVVRLAAGAFTPERDAGAARQAGSRSTTPRPAPAPLRPGGG